MCHTNRLQLHCAVLSVSRIFIPTFSSAWLGFFTGLAPGNYVVVVDEAYLKESILTPQLKITAGFEKTIMPEVLPKLSDQQLNGIIEYIKSLK